MLVLNRVLKQLELLAYATCTAKLTRRRQRLNTNCFFGNALSRDDLRLLKFLNLTGDKTGSRTIGGSYHVRNYSNQDILLAGATEELGRPPTERFVDGESVKMLAHEIILPQAYCPYKHRHSNFMKITNSKLCMLECSIAHVKRYKKQVQPAAGAGVVIDETRRSRNEQDHQSQTCNAWASYPGLVIWGLGSKFAKKSSCATRLTTPPPVPRVWILSAAWRDCDPRIVRHFGLA
ncbi:hypothetical protein DFH05DRAFT_1458257 [Lentinula detonsa]|uniref:Uncharacterized protein n=1 Tax=Lentinula detonsa TaxID=2804962 RepID=A0A9W8P6P1_9AGAR|nr:hypothetical protein DFH05DRAFT_1458257 [Lentinula detonsa]